MQSEVVPTPARGFRRLAAASAAWLFIGVVTSCSALAAWPDRTITIIVQFAPGGSNDLLGRILAAELAPALGQNFIVENHPGAAGNIGAAALARAVPDGYTLGVLSGPIFINPNLTKVAYDPIKDFAPIAYLGASPNVILTSPNSAFANIQQMISEAKANPGKINFATPGAGSVSHLSVEFLKLRAGINLVHVPYSGAAPAAQAAIARTTRFASVNISGMLGHVQSGALRALVQTGRNAGRKCRMFRPGAVRHSRCRVGNDAVFARAGGNTARDHRPSLKRGACDPAEARCPGPDVKGELCRERRGS